MLNFKDVDWLTLEATLAVTTSVLCRIDAELKGVGLSKFAVTTLFPVLTRTYGLFRIDSGMVDPEVAHEATCEDGTIMGDLLFSLEDDGSVVGVMTALFLII